MQSAEKGASSAELGSAKGRRHVRQSTIGSARRKFNRRKRRQDKLSKRMTRSRDASKGVTVFPGHRNWDLMMNVMQGIQLSVGRMASASAFSYTSRPISVHDFAIKEKYTLTGHVVMQASKRMLQSISVGIAEREAKGKPQASGAVAGIQGGEGGDAAAARSGGGTKAETAATGRRKLKTMPSIMDDPPMAPRFVDYAPRTYKCTTVLYRVTNLLLSMVLIA